MKRKKILICGFYGCGNLGDDGMLLSLLDTLVKEEDGIYTLTVSLGCEKLAVDPLPYRVKRINRKGIALFFHLFLCNELIFGGGSLLQNTTGNPSLIYYLSLMLLGKLLGKRVRVISAGLSPINGRIWRWFSGTILRLCDEVTLRDELALSLAASLGVRSAKYRPDLCESLKPSTENPWKDLLPERFILVIPRKRTEISPSLFADEIVRYGKRFDAFPVFADFFPKEDGAYLSSVISLLWSRHRQIGIRLAEISPTEMLSVVGRAVFVMTMRYHGGIFARNMGIPFRVYGNDPKLIALEGTIGNDRETFSKKIP